MLVRALRNHETPTECVFSTIITGVKTGVSTNQMPLLVEMQKHHFGKVCFRFDFLPYLMCQGALGAQLHSPATIGKIIRFNGNLMRQSIIDALISDRCSGFSIGFDGQR